MAGMAALGVVFGQKGVKAAARPELSDLGFGGGNFLLWRQRPTRVSYASLRLERAFGVEIRRALQYAVERHEAALYREAYVA